VLKRSQSQKEVNDLLHRKSSWDDKDVLRFTSLVREDHGYEQEESRAKEGVLLSEQGVDTAFDDLLRAILSR
jgi:sensitive to high expression protein 9